MIESLKLQGAKINVWGVGTKLVTGGDQSALGGVYKLSAVRDDAGDWQPRIKLSEQAIKISTPGLQQIRRFSRDGKFIADAIFDAEQTCPEPCRSSTPRRSSVTQLSQQPPFMRTCSNRFSKIASWSDIPIVNALIDSYSGFFDNGHRAIPASRIGCAGKESPP